MLRTTLFGAPHFTLHNQPITVSITGRRLALFAYLHLHEQPCPRGVLLDLLWHEIPEAQAREYLRTLLYHMRQALGDYLVITRESVGFNRQAPYWSDIEAFSTYLTTQPPLAPVLLHKALDLYQGEFLAGFAVQGAPIFASWLTTQRQHWHAQALQGWQQLTDYYWRQGDDVAGLATTQQMLTLAPSHERAHRQQMVVLARRGERAAALAHFEQYCTSLQRAGSAQPGAETIALYEALKAGRDQLPAARQVPPVALAANGHSATLFHSNGASQPKAATNGAHGAALLPVPVGDKGASTHKTTNGVHTVAPPMPPPTMLPPTLVIDGGAMPQEARFYGRQGELAQLHQWAVDEQRPVIALVGAGGQGKTALAVRFIRTLTEPTAMTAGAPQNGQAVAPPFERVIWRSLVAAPPLADILQDWLQQLSDQQAVALPPTLDGQFTLLHTYLQQRRFLLVLDNIESVLATDGSGACRPGYEGYEQLWQLFTQREQGCCLLLTSRERPRLFSNQEEQQGTLRTLLLDGLALTEAQQFLRAHRIVAQEAAIVALLHSYAGNPLALKLMADTIDELFGGDVEAFLQEETPFFADIGAVLDQQFARLSPLEVELLTWLALEQEAVTRQTLWENLVMPPLKQDFLTALRALVRRSLVQAQGERFGLQNVILEYTRDRLVNRLVDELATASAPLWQADQPQPNAVECLRQSAFNRYALLKAQAKAYVRAGQRRLLLEPLVRRLWELWGNPGAVAMLRQRLAMVRQICHLNPHCAGGYAATNLLHLLLHRHQDLAGWDFSGLTLRQAALQSTILGGVNFAGVTMQNCVFTDTFPAVTALTFHPLNGLLIAGGFNGAITAWEVAKGALSARLPNHGQIIFALTFSHDGAKLVTSGIDQRICLWDWATHELHYTLQENANFVRAVVFSPDDEWLIVAGGDGAIKFYDAATGALNHTLTTPSNWIWSVALSADGRHLAAGSREGPIYYWTLDHWMQPIGAMQTLSGHQAAARQLLFSPAADYLYSAGHDHLIHIWSITDCVAGPFGAGQPWRTLRGHTDAVRALALSPHGDYLASGGSDKIIRLWHAPAGALVDTLVGHQQWVWALAFQPCPTADPPILVSSGNDQSVLIWEIGAPTAGSSSRLRQTLQGYADSLRTICFHPNGRALISGGFDKVVRIWDVQTGQIQQTLTGATDWLMPVAVDPAGECIAASGYDRTIFLWRADATHAPLDPSPRYSAEPQIIQSGHATVVLGLAFSPDGKLFASSSQDQTIRLWRLGDATQAGQLVQILSGHTSLVWSLAFSPDGRWLASGSYDQTIRLWDVSQLAAGVDGVVQTHHTFTGHTGPVWSIAFTPDSKGLVSGSSDQTVRIWQIGQPSCSHVLTGHTNIVRAVAVSPQPFAGRLTLASCDDNRSIRLWDAARGETIHQLYGHESFIHSLAYSPDGRTLASASEQGNIRLWDVQSGALLQTLRAPRPYNGMNITGLTGLTPAQKAALIALGAVDGG